MKRIIAVLLTVALILPMAVGGMTLPASASAPATGKYVITGGGTVGFPDYALNTTTYTGAELGTILASTEAADSGVSFSTDRTAASGAENYVIELIKIEDNDYAIRLHNGNYLAAGGVTNLVSYTKYEGVPEAHWNIDEANGVWTIRNVGYPDKYLGFSESAHYFRTFTSGGIKPVLYQFTAQTGGTSHEVSLQQSIQSTGTGSITATCSGTQYFHSGDAAAPTVFSVTDNGRVTLFFEPSEGSSLSKVRVNGIETEVYPSGDGYSLTVSNIIGNTFVTAVWVTGEVGNLSDATTAVVDAPYEDTTYDLEGTASSDPLSVATVNTAAILEGSVFTDKSVQYNQENGSFTNTLSLNSVAYETATSGSVVIPMDVVIVLDISGSMNTVSGSSYRMSEVVDELSSLTEEIISSSTQNRVGLVTFSGGTTYGSSANNAKIVVPLGRHERIDFSYTNQNTFSNNTTTLKGSLSISADGGTAVTQTVVGGTYTQGGIGKAYEVYSALQDRTVTLNGQTYERTPVLILVTDGCPTWASSKYTASSPGTSTYGTGSEEPSTVEGNVAYYTIRSAQYFRKQIMQLYDNNDRFRFYTVGVDMGKGTTFPGMASVVLDPTSENIAAMSTNAEPYNTLRTGLNSAEYKAEYYIDGEYFSYADKNYDVQTGAGSLHNAFREIVTEVQTLVSHVMPVVENSTVRFYDALGKDMELKSTPVLSYNGTTYSPASETHSGNKTVYHFSGTVQAFASSPTVELSELVVTKEQDANGIWIVRWEIPSALVPAYIYNDAADAYIPAPTALLSYEVGPTDAALSAVSGTRTFYSNYYDEDGYHAYSTYGLNTESPYYKTYYGSLNPTLDVSKPENTSNTDSYSGYTTHNDGTLTKLLGNNGTLTVTSKRTDITVKKLWKNPNGTLCDAPEGAAVTAQLWQTADGQTDTMIGESVLSEENNWQYTWKNLPLRDDDHTYTYFGTETAVSGTDAYDYTTVEAPDSAGELRISNYCNRMTITLNTDWYYNGVNETRSYKKNRTVNTLYYKDPTGALVPVSSVEPIVFDATGEAAEYWNDRWTDLPIRNADGTPIEYVVAQEIMLEDSRGEHTTFYTAEDAPRASECEAVTGIENPDPVVQIDNYLENPPTSVTVNKIWADGSGSSQDDITVSLYRSATAEEDGKLIETATFGKNENWHCTFEELASGYYYYVREAKVSGYSAEYSDPVCQAEDGSTPTVTVTNTPYPTTGLALEKIWQTDSGTKLLDAGNMPDVRARVWQIDRAETTVPTYTVTFKFVGHTNGSTVNHSIASDQVIRNVNAGATATLNFTTFNDLHLYNSTNTVTVSKTSGKGTVNSSEFTHTVGGTSQNRTMTYGGSISVLNVRSDVVVTVTNEFIYNSTTKFTNQNTSSAVTGGDQPVSETSENLYQTVTLSSDNGWYANLENLPTVSVSEDGYTTHTYSYYVEEQSSSYDPDYIGNDEENGITEGKVQIVNTIYPEIIPDTVVFDFGLPMDVEVLDNDRKSLNISGVTLSGVSTDAPDGIALNTGVSTVKKFGSSCDGTYGSFSVLNDKVRCTPATTNVPGIDTVYYEIFVPGVGYMYSRLDVAPATNVYFEESFLANSGYGTVGTADSRVQSDRNVLYGNDAAYDVYEQNSLGRCYAVSVNDPNRIPEATFTFTGTGFDIISRSTPDSGVMVVEVHQENAGGATVRYFITDNYLAEDSLYQLPVVHCTDLSYGTYFVRVRAYYNAIFDHSLASTRRVPDMSRVLSDLGWQADAEYIYSPAAASGAGSTRSAVRAVANAASGSYNVYVDGVRIFNPLGASPSGVGGTLYGAAGETGPEYIQIRSVLLDAGSWDSAGGGIVNPVMYIADKTSTYAPTDPFITNGVYLSTNGVLRTEEADGYTYLLDTEGSRIQYNECDVYTVIDEEGVRRYCAGETELTKAQLNTLDLCYYDNIYRAQGPENEAYLTNGNGIAFAVESNTGVHISAKSPNGLPVKLCVYDGTRWVEIATITSASEMFYDLTPYTRDCDNIIVKCTADGDGILSLCQIKRLPPVSTRRAASRDATQAEVVCAAMHAMDDGDMIRAEHTHIWEKTSDTATCTDRGMATFACTVCENTRTVSSPAHGHTYAMELTPVVGCIADGELVFTCTACGESITRVLPRERHTYIQQTVEPTDGEPGYILYTCTGCGFSFRAAQTAATPDFAELKIASAYLRLDEDIDVIFSTEVPKDCTDAYMTFSFNGKDTTVTEHTVDADGRFCFAFTGVTPQFMGEAISASLYASKDGETYVDTLASYSVRDYCTNVMTQYPDNAKLQTLLSDLLVYGAAAQTYTDVNTNALVTSGLDLTPSVFPEQPDYSQISFSGDYNADTDWTAAGLVLSNNLAIRFTFRTDSVDGLSIQTELNGRTQTFTAEDFTPVYGKENTWYVTVRGICATEFADTVSASFFRDGVQIGRTVGYSVNTYIGAACDNAAVPALAQLVKALYNYGCSAKAYIN